METKKKFSMIELFATVITVILVVEAAAPVAAIGNSQVFWWILLTIIFLLPYGLIASELGTTYQSEGGMVDWIDCALGHKWAARSAWYYWVNFPIWMASLAIMVPLILEFVFGVTFGVVPSILMCLAFIWIVTFLGMSPAAESTWLFNLVAVLKAALAIGVGVAGIYFGFKNGFANDMSLATFFPSDLESITYIPVVLFNFLGFEVVCTFVDQMENPEKQIPFSIIVGGLFIVVLYLLCSFGIGAAIPVDEISADVGIMDAVVAMTGQVGGPIITIVAIMFLGTFFGNMVSWNLGVNNAVAYSAEQGEMPKVFAKRNAKGVPSGAAYINGIVASIIVIIAPFIPNQDMFWAFFSLNLFAFLASYLPMFPAFLKLRKIDPDTERPYRVPGGEGMLKVMAWLPFIQIVLCLLFTCIPLSFDAETLAGTLPITIGAVLIIIIDEVYIRVKGITNERADLSLIHASDEEDAE